MVAVAAGVARFLSVESCGQCTPCKTDGTELATLLERLARSNAKAGDLQLIEDRIGTVGYGATATSPPNKRPCSAASSTSSATSSTPTSPAPPHPVEPLLIAELLDVRNSHATIDEHHRDKQPDWSYRATSSGSTPVELEAGSGRRRHGDVVMKTPGGDPAQPEDDRHHTRLSHSCARLQHGDGPLRTS